MATEIEGDLPPGWTLTTLGEFASPGKERFNPASVGKDCPYIGLEHIEKDTGRILGHGRSTEVRSTKTIFHAGDVLYGKLRPYLNKVAVLDFDGVCSTDILVFPMSDHIESKFLYYRLLSRDFVQFANENVSGVQHPRTDFLSLSRFRIALPPLAEQRRIADTLSKLFSQLSELKDEVSNCRNRLDQYERALRKRCMSGEITASWRESNAYLIPTGEMIIRSIIQENESGRGKRTKSSIRVQTIANKLGWIELPLELVITWANGKGLTIKETTPGIHPVYGGNGQTGFHNEYLTEESAIVIGRVGAQCGNIHMSPPKSWVSDNAIYSKRVSKSVNLDYLKIFLYEKNLNAMAGGTGQPYISQSTLNDLVLELPSILEQNEIVQSYEHGMRESGKIKSAISKCEQLTVALRQAVLAVSFQGKLVPQDPSDEPASVLLERIRAERAKDKQKHAKVRGNQERLFSDPSTVPL